MYEPTTLIYLVKMRWHAYVVVLAWRFKERNGHIFDCPFSEH